MIKVIVLIISIIIGIQANTYFQANEEIARKEVIEDFNRFVDNLCEDCDNSKFAEPVLIKTRIGHPHFLFGKYKGFVYCFEYLGKSNLKVMVWTVSYRLLDSEFTFSPYYSGDCMSIKKEWG